MFPQRLSLIVHQASSDEDLEFKIITALLLATCAIAMQIPPRSFTLALGHAFVPGPLSDASYVTLD